jgi:hypothetical protein
MEALKSFDPIWIALSDALPGGKVSTKTKKSVLARSAASTKCFYLLDLPSLGKSIYRSFETGYLEPVANFAYRHNRPVFLKELFSLLYDREGILRSFSDYPKLIITARKLLQLCMVFYKYEDIPCADNSDALVAQFKELQLSRKDFLSKIDDLQTLSILSKARVLILKVLGNHDPRDIMPYHGSGVVKTQEANWEKWTIHPYYPKLQELYPDDAYMFASLSHVCDTWQLLEDRETRDAIGVRITFVPKNASTKRMIAVEEAYPQYLKMGLMDRLYEIIQSNPLTKGYVNFNSQEENRFAAQLGSIDRSLCTIDLSSASDSVYKDLVAYLFPKDWAKALLLTRAEFAEYGEDSFPLETFATMGSACCFPVEALVFWAVTSACVGHTCNFVYGDDIICDNDAFSKVHDAFNRLGFMVNEGKSYHNGPFRESCGGDFILGEDVSVVRLIHDVHTNLESTIEFINNVGKKYGESCSDALYRCITDEIGFLPLTTDRNLASTAVVRSTRSAANDCFLRRRYNRALQRYEYRVRSRRPSTKKGKDAWFETMRSTLRRGHRSTSGSYDDSNRLISGWSWVALG